MWKQDKQLCTTKLISSQTLRVRSIYWQVTGTARPRDTRPLGGRTLQIRGFELGPKTLDIHRFWPKALKKCVFYMDFDLKPWKYQLHNALFLRYSFFRNYHVTRGLAVCKFLCHIFHAAFRTKTTQNILYIRRLMVSTNQADPGCFYFRISWILMERYWFYFLHPLHLMQGLRSLKHWLLQKLSTKTFDQKFSFLIKK